MTSAIKGKLDAYRDEIKLRSDPFTRERYRPGELTNFVYDAIITYTSSKLLFHASKVS